MSAAPSADSSATGSSSRPRSRSPRPRAGRRPTQILQRRELRKVLRRHDETDARWLDYEIDVAKLLDFPLMTDMRNPLTMEFHKARRRADLLRPENVDDSIGDREAQLEYRDAVHDYVTAFDVAEAEAIRLRRSGFSDEDQQRIARAQNLLRLADDDAATPQERQSAYTRARLELDGILVLPVGHPGQHRTQDRRRARGVAVGRACQRQPSRDAVQRRRGQRPVLLGDAGMKVTPSATSAMKMSATARQAVDGSGVLQSFGVQLGIEFRAERKSAATATVMSRITATSPATRARRACCRSAAASRTASESLHAEHRHEEPHRLPTSRTLKGRSARLGQQNPTDRHHCPVVGSCEHYLWPTPQCSGCTGRSDRRASSA